MALEPATHINDLVITNPDGLDDLSQGDNHLRMIKDVLKRDLPLTTPATALGLALLTSATAEAVRPLVGASNTPFRNKVINGDAEVLSRGSFKNIIDGAPLTYLSDRFYGFCSGTNVSANFFPGNLSFVANGVGNTGFGLGTRLQAINTSDLAGNNATLSFNLRITSGTASVNWAIYRATITDSFGTIAAPNRILVGNGSATATTTNTKYSQVVAIPASAALGLEIVFSVLSLSNLISLEFSQVQLEKGSIAASDVIYEKVDIQLQKIRCDYYYRTINASARFPASAVGQVSSNTINYSQMRIVPTVTQTAAGLVLNATSNVVSATNKSVRYEITSTASGDCYAVDKEYSLDAEMYT